MNWFKSLIKDKGKAKQIYFLSLFFVGLPPFFLFSSFLNLHTAAKAMWLGLFSLFLFGIYEIRFEKKEKIVFTLFSFLFIAQSLSSLGAVSVGAFLSQYEDVFFTAIFFFVSLTLLERKDIKKVVYILFFVAFVNTVFQLLIFFRPQFFLSVAKYFLHQGYLDLIALNVGRKRVYFEAYDEMLIPLTIFLFTKEKERLKRGMSAALLILISLTSFISNFRTRFIMLSLSFLGSFVAFFNFLRRKMLILGGVILLSFWVLYSTLSQSVGFTVINRLLFEHRLEDVETVTARTKLWGEATDMGVASPVFGVGLGNYYDHLSYSLKENFSIFEQRIKELESAIFYPHNMIIKVFAETGFLGLLALGTLLVYFLREDLKSLLKGESSLNDALAISFWILFSHAMVNPSFTVKYQALFWLTRALILKAKS